MDLRPGSELPVQDGGRLAQTSDLEVRIKKKGGSSHQSDSAH